MGICTRIMIQLLMRFSVAVGILLSAKPLSASLGDIRKAGPSRGETYGTPFSREEIREYAVTNPIAFGFCRYETVTDPMMRLRQIGQSVPESEIAKWKKSGIKWEDILDKNYSRLSLVFTADFKRGSHNWWSSDTVTWLYEMMDRTRRCSVNLIVREKFVVDDTGHWIVVDTSKEGSGAQVAREIAKRIEKIIWKGAKAHPSQIAGIRRLIDESSYELEVVMGAKRAQTIMETYERNLSED